MPVQRPQGSNTANIVLGTVSTPTARYPEGMRRVVLIGDPTRALGAIAEPECRRVLAALALASVATVAVSNLLESVERQRIAEVNDLLEEQVSGLEEDDPAVYALAVYDFLTWLQETLAHALTP